MKALDLTSSARPSDSSSAPAGISQVSVVFADSSVALERARRAGLNPTAQIRSLSPALILSRDPHIKPADIKWCGGRMVDFQAEIAPLSKRIHEIASQSVALSRFALSLARLAVSFQGIVYAAGCLDEADFSEPRLWLDGSTGNAHIDERIRPHWPTLLGASKSFSVWRFDDIDPPVGTQVNPSFLTRLRLGGISAVTFTLLRALWRYFPLTTNRNRLILMGDNEILRDAAVYLGARGFALVDCPSLPDGKDQLDLEAISHLHDVVAPVCHTHFSQWMVPQAVETCVELFLRKATSAIERHFRALSDWPKRLAPLNSPGKTVLLCNGPTSPEAIALSQTANALGIPFVVAQHGVGREFCALDHEVSALYETAVADLFLTFNDAAGKVSQASPFAKGSCQSVGFPTMYKLASQRSAPATEVVATHESLPPLLYVSTMPFRSSFNLFVCTTTDAEKAVREIDILECVLGHLPHRIFYKSYPAVRFVDPSPILERARSFENITVFDHAIDLRYIIGQFRVIISSRATSTIGWCIAANRPLVYIDDPWDCPMTDDARPLFEAGLFYFNFGSSTFFDDLGTFLAQPIEAIEALWNEKATARAHLVKTYFADPLTDAGMESARAISQCLSQAAPPSLAST